MHNILILSLAALSLSLLAKPGYADQFIENVIRECTKYEFGKKEDDYTTVTEIQEGYKSISNTCTYHVNSACKNHNSQSCVSSINRYRGKEPERRTYYRNDKNKQITVISKEESKDPLTDTRRSRYRQYEQKLL